MGGHDAVYHFGNRTDRDHNHIIARKLMENVVRTFPALEGVRFTHHWRRPTSVTLDPVPALGRLGRVIVYSVGCMGHGGSLTQLNGRTSAGLLLETLLRPCPAREGGRCAPPGGGPVAVTLDLVPAIGRLGRDIFSSVGCMGHGVSLTQLNGRTLADLVLDATSELTEAFFVGRR